LGFLVRLVHFWAIAGTAFPKIPIEGDYRSQLAAQLLAEGRREDARRQVEQAEGVYGRQINVSYPNYNLGLLYLKLNEPVKARAFLERFLVLAPQDPLAAEVRRLLAGL